MKSIYILLVGLCIVILGLSVRQLLTTSASDSFTISDSFKGFPAGISRDSVMSKMNGKFNSQISIYKSKAEDSASRSFWLSFLVTFLASLSVLVSSAYGLKDGQLTSKTATIALAVLTFLVTLANWGSTETNKQREESLKRMQELVHLREEFITLYSDAKDPGEKERLTLTYENMLTDK